MDKYTLMSRAGIWNKQVIESSHINESNEDAYSLHRMAGNIGQSTAEEFLANHSVDLELLTKAIQQGTINQYELRDVINGSAHPSKIKAFNDEFVTGSINESQHKVAGQPVTLNKGEASDGTDWTVTFKNNVEVPLSDVLALIDPMPSGITKTNVNESQWADQVPGNDEIVWVKTKEMGSKANYTPFYRGHEFDKGGYTFGSQSEMDKYINDYILSNQMYNKLKHEPVKPIKINEVEQGETGLMDTLTSSGKLVKPDGGGSMNGQYYQLQGGTDYDIIHFDYDSNSEKPFGVAQVAGHHMPTQLLRKLGFRETRSWTAGVEVYIPRFDGNSNPKYISEQEMAQLVEEWGKGVSSYAKTMGDFYKDRGRTSGTID